MGQSNNVQLLSELILDCQEKRLIAKLAEGLGLRRQTIYLWRDIEEQNDRRARSRLWEISNINIELFPELEAFVRRAGALIESGRDEG